jgi:hypothetical protein
MWWVSDEDADGYTAFAALVTSDVSHREHVWRATLRPASITKEYIQQQRFRWIRASDALIHCSNVNFSHCQGFLNCRT